MITPVVWNLTLYIGGTFYGQIAALQPNSQPMNLSGYSAVLMVRGKPTDAEPLFVLTTEEDGGLTINVETGVVAWRKEDTLDLTPTNHADYDLQIISAGGTKDYLMLGKMDLRLMTARPEA